MNLISLRPLFRLKSKVPQQIVEKSWSDREAILSPGVNLFCWRRPSDTWITNYLNQLIHRDLKHIKVYLSLPSLRDDLNEARKSWDPTFDPGAHVFWNDLSLLAKDFLHMSATGAGTLHLRIVRNDACAKFHLDGYDLRLFTTYYGPGTEWLPENAVNRAMLGKSNDEIVKDPKLIQRMQPFEVGILKGEIPNKINTTPGIVHRSPAITGSSGKRIIMRIDI